MTPRRIVLASTSRYRAALLRRIVDDFAQRAPDVDEAPRADESPAARATRLAAAKATALATPANAGALVIGSDQVAALGAEVLHKPGTLENARQQLHTSSGKVVDFYTGISVIDAGDGRHFAHLDHTRVVFRTLTDTDIARYLARDQPFDCAGSFKAEAAGSVLFERLETQDPTALIGLPLIALARLLRAAGMAIP
jgi:septum formation protein